MKERINKAVDKAEEQFWASIARSFPEISTGDIHPMDAIRFSSECEKIVEIWFDANRPSESEYTPEEEV